MEEPTSNRRNSSVAASASPRQFVTAAPDGSEQDAEKDRDGLARPLEGRELIPGGEALQERHVDRGAL